MSTSVCLADPNLIFCEGMSALFAQQREYKLLFYTQDGDELIHRLEATDSVPEVCLISPLLAMSTGESVLTALNQQYPNVKSIAICENNSNLDLFKLLEVGVKAQIRKMQGFTELLQVMDGVRDRGYFYDAYLDAAIAQHFNRQTQTQTQPVVKRISSILLTERQREFMRLCCSEMNYREIADHMGIRPSTALKFREIICEKLQVKTRMGIMMYALEHGIYKVGKSI